MKTDILIPLGNGSKQNNLELRYCLRSIELHLKEVGQVVIIGVKPDWVQNIRFIPAQDSFNNWERAENIYKKILKGCKLDWLSEQFLYAHDDHFLLHDYVAGKFPDYHRGLIRLKELQEKNPQQYRQMRNTTDALGYLGFDFDIHCPMLIDKQCFISLFKNLEWPDFGYGIKSYYGNNYADTSTEIEDLKFNEQLMRPSIYSVLDERQWFSIGDNSLTGGDMKQVLQELYPNKSKYEI